MKRIRIAALIVTVVFWAMDPLPAQADTGVSAVITLDVYNAMFPNKDTSICPANGFYTYDSLIQAASGFPAFGTSGGDELSKRELAAFFGQASHETNGGAAGQYTWGLCFKEEINNATSSPYYGRGPLQITGQAAYQQAGDAIGVDLVSNPDLAATDPVISWKTALWLWLTAQPPKPSPHDVMIGNWTPSSADTAAGRVPGYGLTTNILNGGLECGIGRNDANVNRIGYYQRYSDMFGIGYGSNLDCYTQQPF